jgi:integrase
MRSENTFSIAARQFVEEHASTKTRRWKETARLLGLSPLDLKTIQGGLVDRWHNKPITEISTDDVYALVDEARRQGIPGIGKRNTGLSEARARAMFSCLSKMFGWLVAHRRTKTNPCVGIPRPAAPPARERVLGDAEIRWFWTACDGLGSPFGPLLKILLVTGARLNEVARMTRHELSDDGSTWMLSGARTKNRRSHTLVLSPLAREVLGEVKVISSEAALVFSTNGRTPVSGFSKMKARLDREMQALAGKEIQPWRLHDLRRTAATGMARAGADLHVIERALNHVSGSFGGIVAVYQRHKFEAEVKRALEAWAELLRKINQQQ